MAVVSGSGFRASNWPDAICVSSGTKNRVDQWNAIRIQLNRMDWIGMQCNATEELIKSTGKNAPNRKATERTTATRRLRACGGAAAQRVERAKVNEELQRGRESVF